ncbi:MAG: flagellar hook-basal body complex protein FliE [Kangiellaceae bacterium]|jgi:flagellar hook-basal body complex protein FliE|nr:flagellar hook-basal body complex protein FliE [Kangiellaceae bacterium]|tara:strand:- start:8774 stop:9103 length:330 start_codon:yes stop_codon:yes gene_type:complete
MRNDISQVLMEMRAIATQAQQDTSVRPVEQEGAAPVSEFGDLLKSAVNKVNDMQLESGALKSAFERGDPGVSLADAMIAGEKAKIGFQATLQVRNKVVDAYKEIMSMSI